MCCRFIIPTECVASGLPHVPGFTGSRGTREESLGTPVCWSGLGTSTPGVTQGAPATAPYPDLRLLNSETVQTPQAILPVFEAKDHGISRVWSAKTVGTLVDPTPLPSRLFCTEATVSASRCTRPGCWDFHDDVKPRLLAWGSRSIQDVLHSQDVRPWGFGVWRLRGFPHRPQISSHPRGKLAATNRYRQETVNRNHHELIKHRRQSK